MAVDHVLHGQDAQLDPPPTISWNVISPMGRAPVRTRMRPARVGASTAQRSAIDKSIDQLILRRMDKTREALLIASAKYSVNEQNELHGPNGRMKICCNRNGYPHVSIRSRSKGILQKVPVHRIIAHQKYGDELFGDGIQVRHLDGDKTNMRPSNIAIGTQMDNYLDMSEERRARLIMAAHRAGLARRTFTMEEVKRIRDEYDSSGVGFNTLARKWGCAKSTMRMICLRLSYLGD